MRFAIELEDRQMRVLCDALDMYSRMGMGQLDVAVEEFLRLNFYTDYYEKDDIFEPEPGDLGESYKTRGYLAKKAINRIKHLVFGHPPNGSWGISNEKVPWHCREAYDIKQILRKALAERRIEELKAEGDEERVRHMLITVDMDSYFPTNPDLPPVKVERKEG